MAHGTAPRRFTQLFDAALAAGTLTAIATGGALLGLGWRDGEAGRVFRLAGRGLLERFGVASSAAPLTSVALGYLHHLVVATAWGIALALLVLPLRGVARLVAALAAAAAYGLLAFLVLPSALRIGYGVTGTVPGAVSIGAAVGVALLGGVWVAIGEGYD
ncbi:MAG: hypothetical protein P3B76_12465 [Gemmatimonadota bacterium]|jgi:hypothetical protein|nr:hypothetical protein [Gemmatimonadota bacterium]MDQ8168634.1 hypothetical protein [Gemmatimonadota bacterium]MDQ8173489.1 hypothetical protein [Gemmatimonadota bacterium]